MPSLRAFAFWCRCKVLFVCSGEMRAERRIDLIACLRNGWPDGSGDPLARRAERFHRRNGVFEHSTLRAAPASMGRADNARLGVGKEDRAAIRRDYAQSEAGLCGDDSISNRATFGGIVPWLFDGDDIRRMNLMRCDHKRLGRDGLSGGGSKRSHL